MVRILVLSSGTEELLKLFKQVVTGPGEVFLKERTGVQTKG